MLFYIKHTRRQRAHFLTHVHTHPQALVELESNVEIRQVLREVFFLGAKEVDAAGKKAICVYVPVPQQKQFQKIQVLSCSTCSVEL